ncbi:C39 family peptidase [Bacillus pseudomycoides]|uniref:C39 family peptidase n=1 Tax=Bacillus pseudomycoides TaxID=64104 RepID=UPI000BEDDA53|nr:C39 family peptidase [Bacillus pseudomycoides]PED07115.1 hypothetical protein COO19_17560 [Bacillus pseudomycoides]PEI95266.1 hypothetical protein CN686_14155 [Bacillus pseudomycoides]PEM72518.1 hypothetical protein CN619_16085 [Bacillus pseudomycoides]PEP69535.1 hypothetical protein CN591_04075 [Bacillus pseudomycoides]PFW70230.1 hypothetical protein COL25_05340 [Bacillus pseudomycoides]
MKKKLPFIILSSALLLSPIHSYANTEISKAPLHTEDHSKAAEQTKTLKTDEFIDDISKRNDVSTDKKEQTQENNLAPDTKEQTQESKTELNTNKEEKNKKEGWIKEGNAWYYYSNNEKVTGWKYDQGSWYYLHGNGAMATGWTKINGSWYLLQPNGVMTTGWYFDGVNWFYLHNAGNMATGWTKINGSWYLLQPNGVMTTGWYFDGVNWFYLHNAGNMATGWTKINGSWYLLQPNGVMTTGWYFDGVNWFYLHNAGNMATGWTKINGSWYLLQSNGVMTTGWYFDGVDWYYLHNAGNMATGWIQDSGKWYYLYEDGVMKKESVYLDAPMIFQLPELHNGCEVVSMTMMLKYHGHNVDKLTLAKQLPVDSTPMIKSAGSILTWGDPSAGFVGDVTGASPGYSIDPAPLKRLLDRYTNSGIDLSGSDFSKIERLLAQGKPVVTWITASFSHPVSPQSWKTLSGKVIQADFDMHVVLVTGYDNDYVYINDPLRRGKGAKILKSKFISSYNYMGKKALSM